MSNRNSIFGVVLFFCIGHLPGAQAVSPAPDGGYAGGNTAEGQAALLSLTTGTFNTAVGFLSLRSTISGEFNTGSGAGALLFNTGDLNTATGAGALLSNVSGVNNTGDGAFALFSNTATGNTAIGFEALFSNTTGGTLGTTNGFDVGPNVAVGSEALKNNTVGSANTAVGYQALGSFVAGNGGTDRGLCTAVGFQALAHTDGANGGIADTAFGYQALFHNTDGFENVAVGDQALLNNQTGSRNTAVGGGALSANASGSFNTVIGVGAGSMINGDGNVCIGAFSDVSFSGQTNTTHIANIGDTPQGGGLPVTVDPSANNQLGYLPSSQRYKEDVRPMNKMSEAIFGLKPVSFRYKKMVDLAQTRAFGLIAEDVEKVDPSLVARNREGHPEAVRYEYINAMLLNEFLKEHEKVQQLETSLANQRKDFEAAIADLKKEMDVKIHKATAQIEVNKSQSRTVVKK
jgi:trimeric autotransporter adhesin